MYLLLHFFIFSVCLPSREIRGRLLVHSLITCLYLFYEKVSALQYKKVYYISSNISFTIKSFYIFFRMGFVPVQAEMEHAIHREFHFLASSNTNQYFLK